MHQHHAYALSVALRWLACIAYIVLVLANAARIIVFRADFVNDLKDPRRAFGLFTFVAAGNSILKQPKKDSGLFAAHIQYSSRVPAGK
jgi:tellurite resistance protein TehA-like permease